MTSPRELSPVQKKMRYSGDCQIGQSSALHFCPDKAFTADDRVLSLQPRPDSSKSIPVQSKSVPVQSNVIDQPVLALDQSIIAPVKSIPASVPSITTALGKQNCPIFASLAAPSPILEAQRGCLSLSPHFSSPISERTVRIHQVFFDNEDIRSSVLPPNEGHGFPDYTRRDASPSEFAKLNIGNDTDNSVPIRGNMGDVSNGNTRNATCESCEQHCAEMMLELSRLKLERLQRRAEMAVKRGESAEPSLLDLFGEARALNSELRRILKMI